MSTESEQEEQFIEVQIVEVSSEPIELYKVLKIANMVGGGGEAKVVISEGYVYLNNELEYQKRKKVYHGDYVAFNGEVYQVEVVEDLVVEPSIFEQSKISTQTDKSKAKKNKSKKTKNKQQVVDKKQESARIDAGKRKPISF